MAQLYNWAYNDWKTIDKIGLKGLVGRYGGITASDYKTITGDDYEAPTTDATVSAQ